VQGNPYCDRFAFLMASMAMKYADTASINRPTANATPYTHRAMDTLIIK
jgi:hypothetical protein